MDHFRIRRTFARGPDYGLLQKLSYCVVLLFLVPLIVLTGLTMSPAITASCPTSLTVQPLIQSRRLINALRFPMNSRYFRAKTIL